MRHRKKSEKLSRSRAQRKALINSLLRACVICERIITTKSKAKQCRKMLDKLITWTKTDTLHHRRLSFRFLKDRTLVKRLFEEIGPRFKGINGGYTRIFDLGYRKGDGAKLAVLELTKIEKKVSAHKKQRHEVKKQEGEEKERKKATQAPTKETKPKKGFRLGVRKIFKKERDAL